MASLPEDTSSRGLQKGGRLVARVRQTLEERGLLCGATRVLVGCSGGPDSQVLLHALHLLRDFHGCELVAASVDHGLREDAAREIGLARELAEKLGIPFVGLKVTVGAGASLQAHAREARYAALQACAREHGAERISVGHTLDDQAETVLARVVRGTSMEGLKGVVPLRADGVNRPLIDVRREDVLAHAAEHGLPFAHDPSNRDTRFTRVRVRQSLLPSLARENPHIVEQLSALADDVREVAEWLENDVKRARERLLSGTWERVEGMGYVRRSALKSLVHENTGHAIQRTHLMALERMLGGGGEVRLPGDVVAYLDGRKRLCFSRVEKRGRGDGRRSRKSD